MNIFEEFNLQTAERVDEDFYSGGRKGMKKEANDMSIKEMQKAIYMKQEKTVDDIMISQIMKQGSSYRPVPFTH